MKKVKKKLELLVTHIEILERKVEFLQEQRLYPPGESKWGIKIEPLDDIGYKHKFQR